MGIGLAKGGSIPAMLTRILPIAALVLLPACADKSADDNAETARLDMDEVKENKSKKVHYNQRFSIEEMSERRVLSESEIRAILKDNIIPFGGEGPIYESVYLKSDGSIALREGGGRSAEIRFNPAQFVGSEICDLPRNKRSCRTIWKTQNGLYVSYGPNPDYFVKLNLRPLETNERLSE